MAGLKDLLGRHQWFLKSRKLVGHNELGDYMWGLRSFLAPVSVLRPWLISMRY
jgi:hypothetical protein